MADEPNPFQTPAERPANAASARGGDDFAAVIAPLARRRGWLIFLAVLAFIGGAGAALSLFGLVIAWLPIWIGVLLVQAAGNLRDGYENGDAERATEGMRQLSRALMLYCIAFIAGVCLYIVMIIVVIAAGLVAR